jgi:hypothetical protein
MEKWLWEQMVTYIQAFSQGNLLLTLVLIAAIVAVTGIMLAMIIRVIRALLPFMAIAGFVALCWQMGLVNWCWQWLGNLK